MKKLIALSAAMALTFCTLTACGSAEETSVTSTPDSVSEEADKSVSDEESKAEESEEEPEAKEEESDDTESETEAEEEESEDTDEEPAVSGEGYESVIEALFDAVNDRDIDALIDISSSKSLLELATEDDSGVYDELVQQMQKYLDDIDYGMDKTIELYISDKEKEGISISPDDVKIVYSYEIVGAEPMEDADISRYQRKLGDSYEQYGAEAPEISEGCIASVNVYAKNGDDLVDSSEEEPLELVKVNDQWIPLDWWT